MKRAAHLGRDRPHLYKRTGLFYDGSGLKQNVLWQADWGWSHGLGVCALDAYDACMRAITKEDERRRALQTNQQRHKSFERVFARNDGLDQYIRTPH